MAGMPIGKFKVLDTLGQGANSSILHIRREADDKDYALKVVPISDADDQKYLDQARHEYRVASLLHHPNLIKIYSLETVRNWLFRVRKVHLLIEYAPGGSLNNHRPMRPGQLLRTAHQIASGLAHMHRRGIFHGDLKPGNILVGAQGVLKIIDYGLAWIEGEEKGRIQGTPEYIAPETLTDKIVNAQTDIYNFGATLYRLTAFRVPPPLVSGETGVISAKERKALLKPILECNPQAPQALCDLIERCMAYKAVKRPMRMSEIRDELEELVQEFGDEDHYAD